MDYSEFWTICSANGIVLDKQQLEQIKRYHNEMLQWNEKVNMISRRDETNFLEHHVLHSLALIKYFNIPQKAHCLDIGTGGGLPGIPLAIARPDLDMLLIDSIEKKIKVTEMFAKHTNLRKLKVMRIRAEELEEINSYKNYFDIVVSRSVAKLANVIAWVHKITKQETKFIFYKGGDLTEEIEEAKKMFLNLEIKEIDMNIIGVDWYKNSKKKIVICRFL